MKTTKIDVIVTEMAETKAVIAEYGPVHVNAIVDALDLDQENVLDRVIEIVIGAIVAAVIGLLLDVAGQDHDRGIVIAKEIVIGNVTETEIVAIAPQTGT